MITLKNRIEIFKRFASINPHPTTELKYATPFELLVAVILSARATDVSVNKATQRLFKVANTPQAILALGEEGLNDYIKTIGLYITKGKHILKMCEILIEKHHGQVPSDRESLEFLPGVGRKTANVILNTLFEQDTIAVDTHIFRVSNRTELAPGKTVVDVEKNLMDMVPDEFKKNAHHWLILHGRYICKTRTPLCSECIIRDICQYPNKTGENS